MSVSVIQQLGDAIHRSWQSAGYVLAAFPELAARHLEEARVDQRLTPADILAWALSGEGLPPQADLAAKFGQPPLTMFRNHRFRIEALFWVDGSTTVHQHAFSGAFQVLAGSSIETRFSFDCARALDGHFALGTLRVDSVSLLHKGTVREIAGRRGLIHSLFHLERPSVSLVVRTLQDAEALPQFTYLRPGIAFDPFYENDEIQRAVQIVRLLRATEDPALESMIGGLVGRADLHLAFQVLRACMNLPDRDLLERLLARVRDRAAATMFREAFTRERGIEFLRAKRTVVKDPELRYLMAVLMNASSRKDALALVQLHRPDGQPAGQIAALLRRLSAVRVALQAGGTAWQPNLLGLPEFDDTKETAVVELLNNGTLPTSDAEHPFLQQLRAVPVLACLFD